MDPAATYRRQVPVSRLEAFQTPTEDVYVIAHMGIAHLNVEEWSLRIEGAVERPQRLSFDEVRRLQAETLTSVIECYGNPVEPDVPTRRVGNVVWGGARLAPLLERAGLQPRATTVWLEAPDFGRFANLESDGYVKDVPLEVVRERPVLLAWDMNGAPLTAEHGRPVRALVPGDFGTNSVKWLTRVYVTDTRPESPFTTRLYNRRVIVDGREVIEPVRALDVHSVIVAPAEGDALGPGPHAVRGWAWSAGTVARVEVSVDGGGAWEDARVAPPVSAYAWQSFRYEWMPQGTGRHVLACRATDARGRVQSPTGRNRIHTITVTVR